MPFEDKDGYHRKRAGIQRTGSGYVAADAALSKEDMPTFMDATDGLAAAYCHFLQMGRPTMEKGYNSWKDFIAKNPDKVK